MKASITDDLLEVSCCGTEMDCGGFSSEMLGGVSCHTCGAELVFDLDTGRVLHKRGDVIGDAGLEMNEACDVCGWENDPVGGYDDGVVEWYRGADHSRRRPGLWLCNLCAWTPTQGVAQERPAEVQIVGEVYHRLSSRLERIQKALERLES
jgi:hypothetical protein